MTPSRDYLGSIWRVRDPVSRKYWHAVYGRQDEFLGHLDTRRQAEWQLQSNELSERYRRQPEEA